MTEVETLQEDRRSASSYFTRHFRKYISLQGFNFYVSSSSSHSFVSSSQVFVSWCLVWKTQHLYVWWSKCCVPFPCGQIFKFNLRLISNLSRHLTGLPVWIRRRKTQHQRRHTLLQIPLFTYSPRTGFSLGGSHLLSFQPMNTKIGMDEGLPIGSHLVPRKLTSASTRPHWRPFSRKIRP